MGAGSSVGGGVHRQLSIPTFHVKTVLNGITTPCTIKLLPESVVVFDASSNPKPLREFSYYFIERWGYGADYFEIVYTEQRVIGKPPPPNFSPPMPSRSSQHGTQKDASKDSLPDQQQPPTREDDILSQPGSGTPSQISKPEGGELQLDSTSTGSGIAPLKPEPPSVPSYLGAAHIRYHFQTSSGVELSRTLLATVHKLMTQIQCNGVSANDFEQFVKELEAQEPLTPEALATSFPMRKFNAAQQIRLIRLFFDPFDRIEAACILHDRLLAHNSWESVLDATFADEADKENIRHKLGLQPAPQAV